MAVNVVLLLLTARPQWSWICYFEAGEREGKGKKGEKEIKGQKGREKTNPSEITALQLSERRVAANQCKLSALRLVVIEWGAGNRCWSDCIMLSPDTYDLPYEPDKITTSLVMQKLNNTWFDELMASIQPQTRTCSSAIAERLSCRVGRFWPKVEIVSLSLTTVA